MSAANRGSKRSERDFYPTPLTAFRPLVPFILDLRLKVWEPACGDRRLINCLNENQSEHEADGDDILGGCNFLDDFTKRDFIVTNPPFSLALEFCDHAIKHSAHVCMLLRLNFLGSKKRKKWWIANEPDALFVLSQRPSFKQNGKTDACEYAWFYWGSKHKGIHHL